MEIIHEVQRKTIHLASFLIPIGYFFLPKRITLSILIIGSVLCFLLDIARFYHRPFARAFNRVFGRVLREHENFRPTGSTYFLVACTLCVLFFDKTVAIVSILILIVSDTSAALVGKKFGKTKLINNKTLEGSSAFLVSGLIVALLFPGLNLSAGILGATAATLIELLPLPVDDNLLIPLGAGLVMQLSMWIT